MKRRNFLGAIGAGAAISTLDWLRFFKRYGVPGTAKELGMAEAAAQTATTEPRFLVYWFQEGGWDGFSMLNPLNTPNDATRNIPEGTLNPSPSWSAQRYRSVGYGTSPNHVPQTQGNISYGFLAQDGLSLFPDLAVVSSHKGNTFHSGARWDCHYGKYTRTLSGARKQDERTVMQAFCEAYGANYLIPNVSWHRWLADGELSIPSYPEGTGYYEKLGPSYAHTIYGKTPSEMRARLTAIANQSQEARDARIRTFTDNLHNNFLSGKQGPSVAAFQSAVNIHKSTVGAGGTFDPSTMFSDATLRQEFGVTAGDEDVDYRAIDGNPARSKESPNTNVQAMMSYELMRAGLSTAFWIENRRIRAFDTHSPRRRAFQNDGTANQLNDMRNNLWNPLKAFVNKLKTTEYSAGNSFWKYTTIVVSSEMGRSLSGDVASILAGGGTNAAKYTKIMDQDICRHWKASSVAFLGGMVQGNRQYGRVGNQTLNGVPIMPNGSLDPAYRASGQLKSGQQKSNKSFVPHAGHIYSTALHLCGLNAQQLKNQGKGRNDHPPLTFIKKP